MVNIPKKAFVKEHKHLIELLGKFSDKRLKKEAADQSKELKEVLRGGGPFKNRLMAFVNSFPGYSGYTIDDFVNLRHGGSPSEFVLAVIQGWGKLNVNAYEAPEDKERILKDAQDYIALAYFRDEEAGTDAKPTLAPLAKKGKSSLAGLLPTEVATAAPAPAPAPSKPEEEPLGRPTRKIKKEFAPMTGRGADERPFPESYPEDVLDVLEAMAFGDDLHLVGSMAMRTQIYAGDFDAYEVVSLHEKSDAVALKKLAKGFQQIVKDVRKLPHTYIGDIKAGVKPEWKVLPDTAGVKDGKVVNYDAEAARARLKALREKKIVSDVEAREAAALLPERPTVVQFLEAADKLKFHVIRWTPHEVLKNKKVLRDGSIYTLEEAFSSPSITKLDVVSLVQHNRFTDFSCIYEFQNNGRILNPVVSDLGSSLKEDVESYRATGNYFKALKREFALAKFKNDRKRMDALTDVLNGDLGRLYQIVSDIRTLLEVLHAAPPSIVKYEVNQFKSRLSHIYSLPAYLSKESALFKRLDAISRLPKTKMSPALEKVADELDKILQDAAKKVHL